MRRLLTSAALALCMTMPLTIWPAFAVQPDEVLDDPVLEERARDLSSEIRCLVCQNESIDESNAQLARDLRILVRERLVSGDTDQQVLDFLVARYGDYVLLRPPVKGTTALLWFGPVLVLLLAGSIIVVRTRSSRSRSPTAPIALSDEEKARVEALLKADSEAR